MLRLALFARMTPPGQVLHCCQLRTVQMGLHSTSLATYVVPAVMEVIMTGMDRMKMDTNKFLRCHALFILPQSVHRQKQQAHWPETSRSRVLWTQSAIADANTSTPRTTPEDEVP